MLNPSAALDKFLSDYLPPKWRRLVHAVILLAGIVVTAILAANGDWKQGLISLGVGLYAAVNRANTTTSDVVPAGFQPPEDDVPDNGEAYEAAGGAPMPEGD